MKMVYTTMGLIAFCLALTGCAINPKAPFEPAHAGFFTSTKAPLTTEFNATPVENLRVGQGSTTNILGLFAFGDCSLRTAAEEGGLKTIEFADYMNLNVLGLYQRTTVTVYGK